MIVKFVLFRLHNHCYNVSVPISSDQGTRFIKVGVDPIHFGQQALTVDRVDVINRDGSHGRVTSTSLMSLSCRIFRRDVNDITHSIR